MVTEFCYYILDRGSFPPCILLSPEFVGLLTEIFSKLPFTSVYRLSTFKICTGAVGHVLR